MSTPVVQISLLHATYRRVGGPLEVKRAWLEAAADPTAIEYIFALDDDDVSSLDATADHLRVVGSGGKGVVTCVRNWNAAAAVANGDLLVVVADDLFPPPAWDVVLRKLIGDLDPSRTAFAVKLMDSPDDSPKPWLLRHPVVSRAYYQEFALFNHRFNGVYCDDDITLRAFWKAMILDGRTLRLRHLHPTLDGCLEPSESHALVNTADEFQRGQRALLELWPAWRRACPVLLVRCPDGRRLTDLEARRLARRLRLRSLVTYASKRARALAELFRRPSELLARIRTSAP